MESARRNRDLARDFTALKLAALDQAAGDDRLTDLDFRTFYFICSATDRQTQVARRKQQIIADGVCATRRAVQACVERLSQFGYIVVLTKDGGTYTNGYRLVLTKANEASSSENTKANPASPYAEKRRSRTPKKAKQTVEKGEAPFAPIFPFNSLDIPSRGRGPSSPSGLGLAGTAIRAALGDDVFHSWFGKVRFVSALEDTVTLSAPTRFVRDSIAQKFDDALHAAWQSVDPNVKRVNIITEGAGR